MLNFTSIVLGRSEVDFLLIPVCEDAEIHADKELLAMVAEAKALEEFQGEAKQQVTLYNLLDGRVRRCLFMGLGPRKKISAETLRAFAGRAVKAVMGAKRETLTVAVPLAKALDMAPQVLLQALAEGACLANHTFSRYKEKPKHEPLKTVSLLVSAAVAKQFAALPIRVQAICQAVCQAREWVSTPGNDKLPEHLGQAFSTAAARAGLKVRTLDQVQLKRHKFGALLAVAAGSAHPPCLVEIVYTPAKAVDAQTIVLVGKGVTFDTGGISIKPAAGMEAMKGDMAGAAAVVGAMLAIAKLKPKQRVIGITPIVENMPSGTATRPGDIVTSFAGKTVEIGNTDAEGRLILIDAMAYAIKKHKPDVLVDLATLTGACVIALGEKIAGVFSRDEGLTAAIQTAGETVHERCWPMPMPDDYKELLKSDLADLSNMSSSRYGGAITAALFLSEFTNGTRWAHIDIAGPGHAKKGSDYCGPGGTGFGVRLLCALIDRL
jgi:leucyl aminopeptidase